MTAPLWMRRTLMAAAAYNLIWGTWVILRPLDLFRWTGAVDPIYPSIWQCVGMIVGVYGIGYAIASSDPFRHWPIVLVGLLGKLFGPIGFLWTLATTSPDTPGRLPLNWGWTIVTNDLIWWLPFAAILYHAAKHHLEPKATEELSIGSANRRFCDQHGRSIEELSRGRDCLIIFLRHSGCTFCREALHDLCDQRTKIESAGKSPILVHMGDDESGRALFETYGLDDWPRISDPNCTLYRAYGLKRGGLMELLGPSVWWRGFVAAVINRHAIGKAGGDGFQMPGAFLVRDGRIVTEFRHRNAAQRPDYCELACRPT
jgi:peroxiredoxin